MVFNKLYNFQIFLSSFEACDHISNDRLLASLLNTPENNNHSHTEHSNLVCKVNHFIYRPLFQVDLLPCSLFHWADFNFVSQQYETFTKRWRIITVENGMSLWYSLRSLGCQGYRQKLEGRLEGEKKVIACIISHSGLSKQQIRFVAFDPDLMTFAMPLSEKLLFSCMSSVPSFLFLRQPHFLVFHTIGNVYL